MQKIKMVDLHSQYLRIKGEIDGAIQRVLESTNFIQGAEVHEFEKNLSDYLGGCGVVTCANGTDALQIAMMALELKKGDEVILPVHTYVATAEVVALLGLTPVFVDVDPATFNIDTVQLKRKITGKTRAIVPVHLYGQCADMQEILSVANQHNLFVIEDTAQALGADFIFSSGEKKKAGTMGTVGCTSFFPSKNLGCYGDGGAMLTNDRELAMKMRVISNHGQRIKYHHEVVGINSRLDTIQAAILNVKLRYLDGYTALRQEVAASYDKALVGLSNVITPFRLANSTHVFHQYTIRAEKRDELKAYLEKNDIPSMIYYPVPLHFQKAYRHQEFGEGSFPETEMLSKTVLSLPIHTEMTNDQVAYIADCIRRFYHG